MKRHDLRSRRVVAGNHYLIASERFFDEVRKLLPGLFYRVLVKTDLTSEEQIIYEHGIFAYSAGKRVTGPSGIVPASYAIMQA
jgi:hypothetical protein